MRAMLLRAQAPIGASPLETAEIVAGPRGLPVLPDQGLREMDVGSWSGLTRAQIAERFPDADLVILASASASRSFAALGLDLPCVSIGPVTSAEARALGLRVVAEAETHDREGLVEAVKLAASLGSSPS